MIHVLWPNNYYCASGRLWSSALLRQLWLRRICLVRCGK